MLESVHTHTKGYLDNMNNCLVEGKKSDTLVLIHHAISFWRDFRNANLVSNRNGGGQENIKWTPPPAGYLKINVDASVDNNRRRAVAMIKRDGECSFVTAKAMRVYFQADVEDLEAYAVQMAKQQLYPVYLNDINNYQ